MIKGRFKYDGERDAEHILETIMHRRNWTATLRDDLAACLIKIDRHQDLAPRRTMTDRQIMAKYITLEKKGNAGMMGADHKAIMRRVAEMAGVSYEDVRGIVLDGTFTEPN